MLHSGEQNHSTPKTKLIISTKDLKTLVSTHLNKKSKKLSKKQKLKEVNKESKKMKKEEVPPQDD